MQHAPQRRRQARRLQLALAHRGDQHPGGGAGVEHPVAIGVHRAGHRVGNGGGVAQARRRRAGGLVHHVDGGGAARAGAGDREQGVGEFARPAPDPRRQRQQRAAHRVDLAGRHPDQTGDARQRGLESDELAQRVPHRGQALRDRRAGEVRGEAAEREVEAAHRPPGDLRLFLERVDSLGRLAHAGVGLAACVAGLAQLLSEPVQAAHRVAELRTDADREIQVAAGHRL